MELKQMIADTKAKIAELSVILVGMEAQAIAEAQAAYDKGVVDGKASMGQEKLYSQEEMDAALNPLNEKVASLETQVAALTQQVADLGNAQAQAVADAVSAEASRLKAEFKAAWEMSQAEEAAAEAKVAALFAEAPAPVEPETPAEPAPETPSEG